MVVERGFEPLKAKPADLQSALVDRLSTPPRTNKTLILRASRQIYLVPVREISTQVMELDVKMVLNEGLEPPTY